MKFHAFGQSDAGLKREKNEDSFLVNEDLGLFIVADGMGGHLGGEYASRLAVSTIEKSMKSLAEDPDATLAMDETIDSTDLVQRLRYSIRAASTRIYEEALKDPNLNGMGTTTVLLQVHQETAYVAHVGDSRAYRFSQGRLERLTEDHSLVNEQLKAGFITEKDAKHHKLKNIITRSVGFQETVDIDIKEHPLRSGEIFLLCSDGLTNMVDDQQIEAVFKKWPVPETACEQLIEKANSKGGDDNITLVVIGFQ